MTPFNPLHHFKVEALQPLPHFFGLNLDLTNQALWTGIATAAVILFLMGGLRQIALVPGRWQALVELVYEFLESMTLSIAGKQAKPFLPLIMTTFLFIAGLNVIGMVPGSFTATSQITTTGYMGVMVFLLVVGLSIYKQGFHFFSHFLPKGTPAYLIPLIVPLEIISFLVRPFTLAVRLAANMVAGHILLQIFATFVVMLLGLGIFAVSAVMPLLMLIALSAMELFVALLQAYIFTVLTCVYLNEALGHTPEAEHEHDPLAA